MRQRIEKKTFPNERDLYGIKDTDVVDCVFAGIEDGESALKETRNIRVESCSFSLRYPLWHAEDFVLDNVKMDEKTRAALWYDSRGKIQNSHLGGIKVLRECRDIDVRDTVIDSEEFAWKCDGLAFHSCEINSVYPFLESKNLYLENVRIKGKYSFQYAENATIKHCDFDTKDCLWHCKNVIIEDCVIKGEYMAWFSENLTLIRCKIIGTQPFCYCKHLKLIDCTMEGCDLSFEYSEVEANILGHVDSIKNPLSGTIRVKSLGELIETGSVKDCKGKVIVEG